MILKTRTTVQQLEAHIRTLDREALERFVRSVAMTLYFEVDDDAGVTECHPAKEWVGSDVCADVATALRDQCHIEP